MAMTPGLWVYDHSTGADRPLSSLSPVRAFSWMDNRTILFSGMRGTAGSASQDTTTYYALPVDGGEAQPLFTVPMRAGRARRLTDGRFVFTATVDMNRPNLNSLSPPEEASALEEYKNRTYDVLEDIPFWANGGPHQRAAVPVVYPRPCVRRNHPPHRAALQGYRLYRGRWPDPLYRSSLHGCPDSAPRCFYLGRGQWRDPVPPGTGPGIW